MLFLFGCLLCILIIQGKFFLRFQVVISPSVKKLFITLGFSKVSLYSFEQTINNVFCTALIKKHASFKETASAALPQIECSSWSGKLSIGTGNAALSSLLIGNLYWLKDILYRQLLAKHIHFEQEPDLRIAADYLAETYDLTFSGIIKAKSGNIIIMLLKIILQKLRRNHLWKTVQKTIMFKAG